MQPRMRKLCSLLLATLLIAAIAARASEDSERLVTQGQAAYGRGLYEEARVLYERAVAADPSDAEAAYGLGLALGKLERWTEATAAFDQALVLRPDFDEAARARRIAEDHTAERGAIVAKRWELRASAGIGYDTNVTLESSDLPSTGQSSPAFTLSAGGRYDLVSRADTLVRLDYDLYQTLYTDVPDFNFRWQRPRITGSYSLYPRIWIGAQTGYNYYTLGSPTYLGEPFVLPFVSILQQDWGLTQVMYRFGWDTYFSQPFDDIRDGPNQQGGLTQAFYSGARYLQIGFQIGSENPRRAAGNDYQLLFYQASIGVGFPAWWQTTIDLMYINRYEDYTEPNSFADFRKTRQDDTNRIYAAIERPITENVSVQMAYYFTANPSNISLFEYTRNVVAWQVNVVY